MCVAPAIVCALDAGVTLVFQPAAYWAGHYDMVHEFSSPDRWMLKQHPLAFVAWVGVWITGICLLIRLLPTPASLVLSIMLILGNATGASLWVNARLPAGFWLGYGMFLIIGILVVATWYKAGVIFQHE